MKILADVIIDLPNTTDINDAYNLLKNYFAAVTNNSVGSTHICLQHIQELPEIKQNN